MKTLFLKNGMPIATAVLAIAGAFAKIPVQNNTNAFAPKTGYTLNAYGNCDIPTLCSDLPSSYICRYGFAGPIAFKKNAQGNCVYALWRL